MARYKDAVCRFCRREGTKLFLKGERCYSDKCAFDRRGYPPGQHTHVRGKFSNYGSQLREKQKVKRMYGVLEKQFEIYFRRAERQKGITSENLLNILEKRLDNVVFRMGFANSRTEARQLVRHRHVLVNGRTINIPSFSTRSNDKIEVREKSRKMPRILEAVQSVERRGIPQWLEVDKTNFIGWVRSTPTREDITRDIDENLIVAFYKK